MFTFNNISNNNKNLISANKKKMFNQEKHQSQLRATVQNLSDAASETLVDTHHKHFSRMTEQSQIYILWTFLNHCLAKSLFYL